MRNATRTEHSRFVVHSENICHLIQEEGLLFRPFSNLSLPHFSVLTDLEKRAVVSNLMSYYQICLDVRATGHSLKEIRLFTEKALQRFDFKMAPEHLALIENDHVVEIYNVKQEQIFRNFRFFEVSSYTLEDLLCRKWYHIYDRKEEDNIRFHEKVIEFFSLEEKKSMPINLGETEIKERETLERLTIHAKVEWFLPIFKDRVFSAVMLLIKARN